MNYHFTTTKAHIQLRGGSIEEIKILRFFFGNLEAKGDWQNKLVAKYKEDFGDSL